MAGATATILATLGHTAGQPVLVEADGRGVVIGAQMVWHADELDDEVASMMSRRGLIRQRHSTGRSGGIAIYTERREHVGG